MATKQKRKLIERVSPPREIRDNTKERRLWQAEEAVRHFEYLLALNVHGTPLTEEVVA